MENNLEQFQKQISSLQKIADEAKTNLIVAKTNLESLTEKRDSLVQECVAYAGVPIEDVHEMIDKKKDELEKIMQKVSGIMITDINNVTQDQLDKLDSIIDEFGIMEES